MSKCVRFGLRLSAQDRSDQPADHGRDRQHARKNDHLFLNLCQRGVELIRGDFAVGITQDQRAGLADVDRLTIAFEKSLIDPSPS